jgi:hypothetical protein
MDRIHGMEFYRDGGDKGIKPSSEFPGFSFF